MSIILNVKQHISYNFNPLPIYFLSFLSHLHVSKTFNDIKNLQKFNGVTVVEN